MNRHNVKQPAELPLPPPRRGWTSDRRRSITALFGFPAHAGMNHRTSESFMTCRRGSAQTGMNRRKASSLHTQRLTTEVGADHVYGTAACAGSTGAVQ